ncbi:MAG: hydrogenase maturation peptidase HycI [Thermoplasmatales archaeon]|nr:hydrogenase maturation peptidase HycI [Candidatus Methanoperedenaceae archaeon]MCG2826368.1 hydrogenase maturation peptidase HycI [Thermoplasmatales archaeon]
MNILMGIGNVLKGDDGIGCYIAKNFKEKNWLSLDCSTAPENFTSVIRKNKPSLLVIVDAADMDIDAGGFRIVSEEKIENIGISTHNMPLSFLINYLKDSANRIIFICIQPKTVSESEEISDELKKSAEQIIKILREGRFEEIETV